MEALMSFGIQGPKGDTGARGPQGATGPRGPAGAGSPGYVFGARDINTPIQLSSSNVPSSQSGVKCVLVFYPISSTVPTWTPGVARPGQTFYFTNYSFNFTGVSPGIKGEFSSSGSITFSWIPRTGFTSIAWCGVIICL